MIFLFMIFFQEIPAFAFSFDSNKFLKQNPKTCLENIKILDIKRNDTNLIAVQRCLDKDGKDVVTCELNAKCNEWFFEIFYQDKDRFKMLHKSFPSQGEKPVLSVKKKILTIKHSYKFGSKAVEKLKFRMEDSKLKLIGLDYSINHNSQSGDPEDSPYSSDFSLNTKSQKMIQIDYYSSAKSIKTVCEMNPIFRNLTLSDNINTSLDNLECPSAESTKEAD